MVLLQIVIWVLRLRFLVTVLEYDNADDIYVTMSLFFHTLFLIFVVLRSISPKCPFYSPSARITFSEANAGLFIFELLKPVFTYFVRLNEGTPTLSLRLIKSILLLCDEDEDLYISTYYGYEGCIRLQEGRTKYQYKVYLTYPAYMFLMGYKYKAREPEYKAREYEYKAQKHEQKIAEINNSLEMFEKLKAKANKRATEAQEDLKNIIAEYRGEAEE